MRFLYSMAEKEKYSWLMPMPVERDCEKNYFII